MSTRDLQRWSRDVAENPGADAFVPLARAYRKQGHRPAALNVVLRGLERDPENVEGHALLALLHVDVGEREKAGDEWETILRLEPDSFDAHRGLGFLSLERGDLERARRHLDAAAAVRADDPAVRQAREVLVRREAAARAAAGPPPRRDPSRVFDALAAEAPFLGAMLLDPQGLILAGSMPGEGRGETLAGMLDAAVEEARRASRILALGVWEGMLLECDEATLYVAPVEGEVVVLIAAQRGAPAGWVVRTAGRARELGRRFLEDGR